MRIISFIEYSSVIRDILNHLGLWLVRARPPPPAYTPPLTYPTADSSHSPAPSDSFYADPDYFGTPIFMHNASSKKACRRNLPELCSKMLF